MNLLRGQPGFAAVRRLLESHGVPAVAIDPAARHGDPISVLAFATPERSVLIEPGGIDGFGAWLTCLDRPLAADHAKEVHAALLRTNGAGPSRWACTHLCALLLAAGRNVDTSLENTARSHDAPIPPPLEAGFAELGEHARAVAVLVDKLIPSIKQAGMGWVSRIEAAAVAPIAEMEYRGMPFDAERWRSLTAAAQQERQELEKQILGRFSAVLDTDLFGGAVLNLESDQDLKRALHATGHAVPNTRRATLAALPPPLGAELMRFRELFKIVSAYGESFLEHVANDGRIHPTFEQIGASTGRMACQRPNLQAVVKSGPHRSCFHTAENRRLVIADYSACELRILAEMSGDPVFAESFSRGEDLHARVASEVFGKPVSKTENSDLRDRAKAINFGLAYGMGVGGLARAIGSDLNTATQLLRRYFDTFPRIGSFLQDAAHQALQRGYATTMTGRRLILDVGDDHKSLAQAERIAKNMPIQGTSAECPWRPM